MIARFRILPEPLARCAGMDSQCAFEVWSKRARAQATAKLPAVQPQVWPSQASLYAQGLENRAQTLPTTFAMDGAQWRAQHFDSADLSGSTLRQRQAEARKALLRTAQQSKQ